MKIVGARSFVNHGAGSSLTLPGDKNENEEDGQDARRRSRGLLLDDKSADCRFDTLGADVYIHRTN